MEIGVKKEYKLIDGIKIEYNYNFVGSKIMLYKNI